MKPLLAFCILLLCLTGCRKQRLTDDYDLMEGEWAWTYTVNSQLLDGPENLPTLDTLVASADYRVTFSPSGRICIHEDGERVNRYRIRRVEKAYQIQHWQYFKLELSSEQNEVFIAVSGDTLKNPYWPCANGTAIPCDDSEQGNFEKHFRRIR